MSRTSCDDWWCDQCSQCSGYMIERNSCQVQVSEHSPGPSSVKSAVFGFYVLGFPYFRSHGGDTALMSEEGHRGRCPVVAQCWHPQQVVAAVPDQLIANGDPSCRARAGHGGKLLLLPRQSQQLLCFVVNCDNILGRRRRQQFGDHRNCSSYLDFVDDVKWKQLWTLVTVCVGAMLEHLNVCV